MAKEKVFKNGKRPTPGEKKALVQQIYFHLFECGDNLSSTGKALGLSRSTVQKWAKEAGFFNTWKNGGRADFAATVKAENSLPMFDVYVSKKHPEHHAIIKPLITEFVNKY